MNYNQPKTHRLAYTLFIIPIILAYLSWAHFPQAAQFIITHVFGYHAQEQAANILWLALVSFFYTWYTFLAIGVAGVFIVAAFIARKNHVGGKHGFYPFVSFLVPAYNEEGNVKRCITSLAECADEYLGNCEIIVIDDGSTDLTYETALSTAKFLRLNYPRVSCRVAKHMMNLGKTQALRTGINKALGQVVAVVDADSEWMPNTLKKLIDSLLSNGEKAVTGYIHPKTEDAKNGSIVALQRLEYSQGLGIDRCAQSLGNLILVVPGAIGVYDAELLRDVLTEVNIRSVTEDSEITLEMHKRGAKIGYVSNAVCSTNVPTVLSGLWHQRLRWFTGWLHNILDIHADLFHKLSWFSALLWYSFAFEFVGAFVDLSAVFALPFLFWFAPDGLNFAVNLLVFAGYGLLISGVIQAVALKLAYGKFNFANLLLYTPFFPFLWLVNVFARVQSVFGYLRGNKGKWHHEKTVKL